MVWACRRCRHPSLSSTAPGSEMTFSIDRRRFLHLGTAATAAALALPAQAPARDAGPPSQPVYPMSGQPDAWEAFKAYDPERDPDARFFRSRVRRTRRIEPLAATQAHPGLAPDVRGGALVAAYLALDGGDDLNRTRYQTATARFMHVERAWQYLDVVVGWNSTGLVPNPALTDAVHRNGGLCLGTMFQPDRRMFDGSDLSQAEVAGRLVKLARYFGFDGYFVNFESYGDSDAERIQDLIETMRRLAAQQAFSDFYIQYYNGFTDIGAVWPGPPHADGRPRRTSDLRADSMMLDQGWGNYGLTHGCCSGSALTTLPSATTVSAFPGIASVFYGMQLYPGPGYFGLMAPTVVRPNGGAAHGSLQIYSVDDGLRKMRNARLDALRARTVPSASEQAEIAAFTSPAGRRHAWYGLHRRFWSGQSGNPAGDNAPTAEQQAVYGSADAHKIYTDYEAPAIRPTDQIRLPITWGAANFIAERSAVAALPFVTDFNTGEGDRFWKGGIEVSDAGWFNLGCQDLLPTWSWWARPLDGSVNDTKAVTVDYDYERAFDGGTSLRIDAQAGASSGTELRLYKTDLAVQPDTEIGLVFAGPLTAGRLRAGLTFADAPEATAWIEVDPARAGDTTGDWRRWTHSLSAFKGRRLAALSLGFTAATEPYRLNIGRLWLAAVRAGQAPARPRGLVVEAPAMSGDRRLAALRLSWTYAPQTRHYDIVSLHGDGTQRWQGRISGDAYFIERLERRGDEPATILHLIPCGTDGQSGEPAVAVVRWT